MRRVYLDMDEVLVDLISSASKVHGTTREALLGSWPPGEWGIHVPLGITEDQFWEPIARIGEKFWEELEPTPWFQELVDRVRDFANTWYLLSTPSRHPSSYSGKVKWIKRYFGKNFDNFVLTRHKYLLAAPDTLLVDDREDTCDNFTYHGGNSILFPAHHNRLWARSIGEREPINYVKARINWYERQGM